MLSVNRGLVPQNSTYSIRSNSPSPTAVTDFVFVCKRVIREFKR